MSGEKKSIDRRDFLKGAVVTGGVAALAGITGCSSSASSTSAASSSASGDSGHTWETAPAAITDISETKDYDIVIIGAGISGNAAADAASKAGATVAVIEQAATYTVHGVDCGSIGSKFQAENGINIPPEEATKLLFRWSQQTADRNLIYQWATRSGGVFDYLSDMAAKNGITTVRALSPTAKWDWQSLDETFREYPDAVSFSDVATDVGMMTADGRMVNAHISEIMTTEAAANGAEYFYNTHAEQLVGDAKSGITGVIVTAEDGSYIQYNAKKGVIMATGDIGGNQEMIDCWAPNVNRADGSAYSPANGNLGEGILMGMWAGAAHQKCPAAPMVHPINMADNAVLTAISMSWLAVNRLGLRYSNEMPFEPAVTNARMNQPGDVAWNIFDANYAEYVQKQFPDTYASMLEGTADKITAGVADGTFESGDSLEDLATKLEIPADTFAETVARYNQMCDSGTDVDFGVPERFLAPVAQAPFYAIKVPAMTLVVIFGLHVNEDSQVCTEDDEAIPGLFAVGNAQGDFFGNSYPVHCPGISHGRALTFGHLVGNALANDTVISKTV